MLITCKPFKISSYGKVKAHKVSNKTFNFINARKIHLHSQNNENVEKKNIFFSLFFSVFDHSCQTLSNLTKLFRGKL